MDLEQAERRFIRRKARRLMRGARSTSDRLQKAYFYGRGFRILNKGITLLETWKIYTSSMTETFASINTICPAILQSFAGIQKILKFSRECMRVAYTLYTGRNWHPEYERKKATFLKKTLQYRISSLVSKALVAILYILTILAFSGIISSPIGLALIATASTIEWLDDKIKPLFFIRNKKGTDRTSLQKELGARQKEAVIGFFNTLSLALIACKPIPTAGIILFFIGTGIMLTTSFYKASKDFLFSSDIKNDPEKYQQAIKRISMGFLNVLTFGIITYGPIHFTDASNALISIATFTSLSIVNLLTTQSITANTIAAPEENTYNKALGHLMPGQRPEQTPGKTHQETPQETLKPSVNAPPSNDQSPSPHNNKFRN